MKGWLPIHLVGIKHPLDFVGIRCFRESQGEQQASFPGLQVVTGDEAAFLQTWATDDSSRGHAAA
jgi:hypothetical protein